ncbi:MAG TPA: GrpB family protein [Gemmatimonadales bacterium]|nr:GrpB family protein [Gemmatimonadales bacterium]
MSEQPQPECLQPPVRTDGPIRLAEADPAWAAQYAREEERIRVALGPRAAQVEHVGSTSVPGLAAKPAIDIMLTVPDSSDEAGYLPDLEAAGYVLQFREPDWYEHRFLRDRNPDVQIHVFTVGSIEVERMLLFRDRLRTRSEERELYERTKRELAARRWDYIQDYADAKSAVIAQIISRAHDGPKH